ncbi:MAG: hypothetical protein OEL82_07460 [Nitrosopumilus sp.]|nr:hypothetical protein [Nitrosopumilus sp.]
MTAKKKGSSYAVPAAQKPKGISELETRNKLVQAIWKKILVSLGVASTMISILVVIT